MRDVQQRMRYLFACDQLFIMRCFLSIRVKIIRMYDYYFKDEDTLELILADSKGDKIHAEVSENLIDNLRHKVAKGDSITISDFGLTTPLQMWEVRLTLHDYKLTWTSNTFYHKVPSIGDDDYFTFRRLGDIDRGLLDPAFSVGQIGSRGRISCADIPKKRKYYGVTIYR